MYKKLNVKEWFLRKNVGVIDYVYGTLGETEKAVKIVMISNSCGVHVFWCPKSCLEIIICDEYDAGEKINDGIIINEDDTIEDLIRKSHFDYLSEAITQFKLDMVGYC